MESKKIKEKWEGMGYRLMNGSVDSCCNLWPNAMEEEAKYVRQRALRHRTPIATSGVRTRRGGATRTRGYTEFN